MWILCESQWSRGSSHSPALYVSCAASIRATVGELVPTRAHEPCTPAASRPHALILCLLPVSAERSSLNLNADSLIRAVADHDLVDRSPQDLVRREHP